MDRVGHRRRSLINQVKIFTCDPSRSVLKSPSLPNFGFGEKSIEKKSEKSLSEIYAPVNTPSFPRRKRYRRKRSINNNKKHHSPKLSSAQWFQKSSLLSKHPGNKVGAGDWFEENNSAHQRIKYRTFAHKFDYFDVDTLIGRMAEEEQELQNVEETDTEAEATANETTPEGADVEVSPDGDSLPRTSLEAGSSEDDTVPRGSILSNGKEQVEGAEKELVDENESSPEPEIGDPEAERKISSRKESEDEKKSIRTESISVQKKDCMDKPFIKRAPSTCSDIIFARPSVMNDLNETYKRLFETQSQVDELKKSIEKYKDASYTEEDAKELKEKEKQLFEKLSELECVTQKLVELGGIPMQDGDFSFFPPDMGTEMFSSDDKYYDDFKKCIDGSDLGDGFEKPKLRLKCGDKSYKKASVFSSKDIKLSHNVPEVSSFLSKAFELPKVIMCRTSKNLPKIIVGDTKKKLNIGEGKPRWPYPHIEATMDPKNEVVICLTDRLKESYSVQDKLVSENVHLEDFQYQLQEEILAKEQALEDLKRQNCQIQNEMKLLVWENKQLQEKLSNKKQPQPPKSSCKKEQSKKMEDNIINRLECQMKSIQKDLQCVQMARKQAESERCRLQEAASSMRNRPTTSPPQMNQDRNCEKIQQLKEKYSRVTDDYKSKVTEVAALHVENENLIVELEEKKRCMKEAETAIKELQDKLNAAESGKDKGPKGQSSQVMVLEQQLRDAKDELEELHMKHQECAYQEEYYREKYLLAQQQVEEQRRQIEMMEADNRRITKQVEEEIQRVKCQFQDKLDELKSLPDVLRTTQCRLQEAVQRQKAAEEKSYELKLEAEDARAKMMEATQKLDQYWNQQQDSINQTDSLAAKAEAWEKKCKELTDCNCKLKNEMKRLEECAAQCRRCAEEKSVEILQLSNQLECVREDSARQVAKAKERCETVRRSYQCQIEDLERQLAQTRASARAAQAERDETRKRMQCEIGNLSENFEQAQSRIRYLQSHVNYLKRSFSNMLDQSPDNSPDGGEFCSCD